MAFGADAASYRELQQATAVNCFAMIIGILQFELTIDYATCLKDKRRVVTSLKDRLCREFKVAVAETARLDNHQVAQLGLTVVGNSVPHVQSVLDHVLEKIKNARDCVLSDHCTEILTGDQLSQAKT